MKSSEEIHRQAKSIIIMRRSPCLGYFFVFCFIVCLRVPVSNAALPISAHRNLGECRIDLVHQKELFPEEKEERFINVLVTRFSGQDDAAEKLGAEVASGLANNLENLMHSNEFKVKPDEISIIKSMRVRYVPCFIVKGHEGARNLGRAWGADLVFWGQAVCPGKDRADCHFTSLSVQGGTMANNGKIITSGNRSPIYIGSPRITIKASGAPTSQGAFKTSLTVVHWHRLETVQQASIAIKLDPKNIQDLDFPRIAAAEPITLFRFMLGVYAFLSSRYSLASEKFLATESNIYAKTIELEPLLELMGISHIYAGREKRGIRLLAQALQLCYLPSNASAQKCQVRSLTNLGWAYAKRKNYQSALEYYAKAAEFFRTESPHFDKSNDSATDESRMKAILYNNIGYAYLGIRDFEKSLKSYERALGEAEAHEMNDILVSIYSNLGYLFMQTARTLDSDLRPSWKAEYYLQLALSTLQSIQKDTSEDWRLAQTMFNRQSRSCGGYDPHTSSEFQRKFYGAITRSLNDAGGVVPIYINLSSVMIDNGRPNAAKMLLDKALPLVVKMGDFNAECTIRDRLQRIYELSTRGTSFGEVYGYHKLFAYDIIATDLEMKLWRRERLENEKLLRQRCRNLENK